MLGRPKRTCCGQSTIASLLIPDFIPIVGRLDDAIIVALAIRTALRAANADLIRQHWPGPQPPPNGILRRAKGRTRSATAWGAASV